MVSTEIVRRYVSSISSELRTIEKVFEKIREYNSKYDFSQQISTDESMDFHYMIFNTERAVEKIQQQTLFIYELLGLQSFLQPFRDQFEGFDRQKLLQSKLEMASLKLIYDMTLRPYLIAKSYRDVLSIYCSSLQEESMEISLKHVDSIVKNLPKAFSESGLSIGKESELQRELHKVLGMVFPDAKREVQIVCETKTYKVDIGIKSLGLGIELKYVNNQKKARKCLGELYEDMKGYSGSNDWIRFLGVIYQTASFLSQSEIDAELKTKGDHNWQIILLRE